MTGFDAWLGAGLGVALAGAGVLLRRCLLLRQ
jgi:hypothetical protein